MTQAIYAGSFDPITNGHLAIIEAGLVAFERIIVAVLQNPDKTSHFTIDERVEMIESAVGDDPRITVDRFEGGPLVHYARRMDVRVILRGLRPVGDFEHELQLASLNHHLAPEIQTVFIMSAALGHISSSLAKALATVGGSLDGIVPSLVEQRLREKQPPKLPG